MKINKKLSFVAVDPYLETNIVRPTENDVRGKDFISWGEKNDYPFYLDSLYNNVPTLKSIIDGMTDYICGNGVTSKDTVFNDRVNEKGMQLEELVNLVANDYVRYGGFAINVVKNRAGGIAGLYYLDFSKCRTDKEHSIVYYTDDWTKSYGRIKYCQYPNFMTDEGKQAASSIYYFSSSTKSVYPAPIYSAAVVSCEVEKKINEFGINLLSNGLNSNFIINMNNGVPADELQEEIENNIYEKFTGTENAGRPIIAWNNDKDHAATVERIDSDGWADKYTNLQKTSREQIYNAFRANPILFGLDQHNTGFNSQEYAEAFKLFNHTVIKPIQNKIKTVFDKIFDTDEFLTIAPYEINFEKNQDEVE